MATLEGKRRVVIEHVQPEIDGGSFPIKRVVGEPVIVQADLLADGHDEVAAVLLYRHSDEQDWREAPLRPLGNDRWEGRFTVETVGLYYYTLQGHIDRFPTWQKDLRKKAESRQACRGDLLIGVEQIERAGERAQGMDLPRLRSFSQALRAEEDLARATELALSEELSLLMRAYSDRSLATRYGRELAVVVDRKKALFSAWYELFPRSGSAEPGKHGTWSDCERLLPEIARMGFDVLYLPPIHPIGKAHRKGKNNAPVAAPEDPGSPWAIGSEEGGHQAIHPALGTLEEFQRFVERAQEHGIEVALDLAFQCSPDHPYVKEHPEWFLWRPDGTVQYAENPPKKYEDVVPLRFETEDWRALWEALKGVVRFWIEQGIRIFRVDNPHTKPFPFWEWLIREIKRDYPEVIFLAEAFTRPKAMYRLAKAGFTQSYTYFTWRNAKGEQIAYLNELTQTEAREYFRPNFWPNTPDILPEYLQYGGRPAFVIRLVLAATLSSNYGIYGPAFELCVNDAIPGREEYLNSEKYEIKTWERNQPGNLRELIARVNRIRRENPALQTTWNVRFYEVDNEALIAYEKATEDLSNVLIIVVNLDPFHTQSGRIRIPLEELGIAVGQPYLVDDLLSHDQYIWQGAWNFVELNPQLLPACIFRVRRRLRREQDFDYFM
ncbi:MAG: alpha-1,4-glucan--maltose-1-phosphate maltosyltransferase [Candidatus Tectomicrobia bacterium]|uniref:Alpha-1,4-glucan:maltose-1-phosphate maltosyltransferase n=1 Tax=Tectimicrobiota bacterium TaxID=2528274 RepID=A0A932CPR9_UNCTE|nr:alpha-1,4-glucan--maltose-1-phosphate maltosyltransferase [Candidatus Tectomicrobia bacterium]